MTLTQAIEKGVEGGYRAWENALAIEFWTEGDIARMLLDPLFWQALGKIERWGDAGKNMCPHDGKEYGETRGWAIQMRALTAALIEGKTIEEFFATL